VTGPAAQRHPLAVLALLAASPGRQMSRDRVVAYLWPEKESAQGRASLNTAVYALRKQLGSDVLRSVADDLYLDCDLLSADLARMETRIAEGRLEDGVAEYAGPFLDGFHLSDSVPFEEWLQGVRDHLHRWVRGLLESLAEAAEGAGSDARLTWTARLAHHDPLSARAAVRHITALADAGDRPAALAFARAFQRRLEVELGGGPDPEVAALAAQLDVAAGPSPARPSASPRPTRTVEDAREPSPARAAPVPRASVRPWWRRPGVLVPMVVVAVVGAVGFAVRSKAGAAPGPRGARANTIVVMPFQVRADPDHQYLGDGLMDVLASRINGVGPVTTVDPNALLTFLGKGGARDGDGLDAARRAARKFDAGRMIVGAIVQVGDRVEIHAGLYAADGTRKGDESVSGPEARLPRMLDDLSLRLVADRLRAAGREMPALAARTTDSLPALRSYMQGEQAFRAGRLLEAAADFKRAVHVDTTFALGFYRLEQVSDLLPGLQRPWWEWHEGKAARLADRLPTFERQLIRTESMPNGEALPILRRLATSRPSSAEAWYRLGLALDRESAARGTPNDSAVAAFERARTLDPGLQQATAALAYAVARRHDYRRLSSLVGELANAPEQALLARTFLAFGREDSAAMRTSLGDLAEAPEPIIREAAAAVTTLTRRPDLSEPIYRLLVAESRPDTVRWMAYTRLADLAVAEGRWTEAERDLVRADSVFGGDQLSKQARLAFLPNSPIPRAAGDSVRAKLLWWFARGRSPEGPGRTIPGMAYNAGMISAARGDSAGVREALRALGTLAHTRWAVRLPSLRASLEAEIAWIAGDPARVVSLLSGSIDPQANQRYLMARALEALGRPHDALRWYQSYPDLDLNSPAQLGWRAASLRRMAGIYDRLGEAAQARKAREEFVRLWSRADASVRPLVEKARGKLAGR
jgi:DNA-binding SARP family transcriptional activator/tetratricopeptide (TPR) repeat protein/TolB-like protein